MNNFRIAKIVTIVTLAASLTAAEKSAFPFAHGTAILLTVFLLALLTRNTKSIVNYYAKLEADSSIPLASDSKIWGVRPKYREMAPYVVPVVLFFGFFSISSALEIANGSQPGRKFQLIYDLFGSSGVAFLLFVMGLILLVASAELAFYLWNTRKNA